MPTASPREYFPLHHPTPLLLLLFATVDSLCSSLSETLSFAIIELFVSLFSLSPFASFSFCLFISLSFSLSLSVSLSLPRLLFLSFSLSPSLSHLYSLSLSHSFFSIAYFFLFSFLSPILILPFFLFSLLFLHLLSSFDLTPFALFLFFLLSFSLSLLEIYCRYFITAYLAWSNRYVRMLH